MNLRSSGHLKIDVKTLYSILHHRSPVIFANTTVMAFLLLRSSRFNFHCYAQSEPKPTQKLARKWQLRPFMTSYLKNYKGHSLLQTSFAELPSMFGSMTMQGVGVADVAFYM